MQPNFWWLLKFLEHALELALFLLAFFCWRSFAGGLTVLPQHLRLHLCTLQTGMHHKQQYLDNVQQVLLTA